MPANGTAGFARSAVSGISRLPSPPASTIDRIRAAMVRTYSRAAQSRYARRPAHPRVPARGLRGRGSPRRVPRTGAAAARRRARPLHGGTAGRGGRHGVRRAGGSRRRQPRAATFGTDLAMAAGCEGRGPRALAHLVRQPRRARRVAAARGAARRERPQPRAAAAVEGRAARRRLRPARPGPSGRRWRPPTRSSRCRPGCATTCCAATPTSTRRGSTWSTTASTPRSTGPTRAPDVLARLRHRPRPAVGGLRRAHHPAEGPAAPAARRAVAGPVGAAGAPCRRAGHRRDPRRGDRAGRRAAPRPRRRRVGASRCCPGPRSCRS